MQTNRTTLADVMASDANNFALLRLLAAAAVVVSHVFQIGTGDVGAQPLVGITAYNLGQHAVNVFFVMSGVMVAGSLERSSSLIDFATARSLRILPGLAVCAALLAFLVGPIAGTLPLRQYLADPAVLLYPFKVVSLLGAGSALPGVFAASPFPEIIDDPLWTLKYEVLCYAILFTLAALGAYATRRAFGVIAILSIAVCVAVLVMRSVPGEATAPVHLARYWLCFVGGVLAYRHRADLPLSAPLALAFGLLLLLSRGTAFELVASILFTGYGALSLAALPGGGLRALTNRTDLSFGIYIYGWPMTQLMVTLFPAIGLPALAVTTLALSIGIALLSWKLVEHPALGLRRPLARWLERRARNGNSDRDQTLTASKSGSHFQET